VTVQPNFEVHVESGLPPVGLVRSLAALGEVVTEDTVNILRLRRDRVAEWGTKNPPERLIPWLVGLSGRPLPANVQTELDDWLTQSDQFTLYTCHGILEGNVPASHLAKHAAVQVADGLYVVEKTAELYTSLLAAALVPTHVRHQGQAWVSAPPGTTTRFPQEPVKTAKSSGRKSVNLRREVTVRLHLSDPEYRDRLQSSLVELRCPVQRDGAVLVYSGVNEKMVQRAMDSLKGAYRVVEEKA
jgi:hypothetical protein